MDALMAVGGFVPLSYVFYGVIQNARQRRQINRLGLFLAFAGVLLPVALITWGVLTGQSEVFLSLAALASAGVMILFGLIAVTQDARAGAPLNRSNGLMGVGAGLLILVAVLIITQALPLTGITGSTATSAMPANFAAMRQAAMANGATTDAAGSSEPAATTATLDTTLPSMPSGFTLPDLDSASAAPADSSATGETDASTVTLTSASAAAPAGFALPDLNAAPVESSETVNASSAQPVAASLTLDQFVAGVLADVGEVSVTPISNADTSVSTAAADHVALVAGAPASTGGTSDSAAAASTCQAVVRNNLNLRAEPSADATLLLTIPYSTLLTSAAISEDGWWQVTYNGQTGWVSGAYLDVVGACE